MAAQNRMRSVEALVRVSMYHGVEEEGGGGGVLGLVA